MKWYKPNVVNGLAYLNNRNHMIRILIVKSLLCALSATESPRSAGMRAATPTIIIPKVVQSK